MKIGSLVECIVNFPSNIDPRVTFPKSKKIYTVRHIQEGLSFNDNNMYGISLEEIVNPKICCQGTQEPLFEMAGFKEIIIPPSIEAEIEEILESELVEVRSKEDILTKLGFGF